MQISRLLLSVCVAAFGLAALSIRAVDNPAQTQPPAATSPETTPSKAELKKQAEANAKALKEAEKKAKAEAAAKQKAEKAERKKQAEADAKARKEAEAKQKAEAGKPGQSGTKAQVGKAPAIKPIETPPLPISADKEQRLKELLQKYRTEEITPEQYHKERAKILAEP
jgi:hypothetical protein